MEQELLSRLDTLAAKLGVTATHLWGVLVAQQALRWVEVVAVLVSAATATLFVRFAHQKATAWALTSDYRSYADSGWVYFIGIGGFVAALCWITFIVSLTYAIQATINPEYFALQEILKVLQ